MITMKFALTFFVCTVISCIFFTLGRWLGRQESSEKTTRSDKNLENIAKRYAAGQALYKSENRIIEAEYEDVVLDLQKFRENRENEKKQLIEEIVGFEWMYSKKDEKMVKIPSDVADLIKYLQRIKTYR